MKRLPAVPGDGRVIITTAADNIYQVPPFPKPYVKPFICLLNSHNDPMCSYYYFLFTVKETEAQNI